MNAQRPWRRDERDASNSPPHDERAPRDATSATRRTLNAQRRTMNAQRPRRRDERDPLPTHDE